MADLLKVHVVVVGEGVVVVSVAFLTLRFFTFHFQRMATICFMGKLFICIISQVFEGVRVWCCVRVPQRNIANRIFTETQKEVDHEELADEILEADKSSDLPLQAGDPGQPVV